MDKDDHVGLDTLPTYSTVGNVQYILYAAPHAPDSRTATPRTARAHQPL